MALLIKKQQCIAEYVCKVIVHYFEVKAANDAANENNEKIIVKVRFHYEYCFSTNSQLWKILTIVSNDVL